jgi:hypothetical protein
MSVELKFVAERVFGFVKDILFLIPEIVFEWF